MKKILKYGGAVTGLDEERAIIKSVRNSRKTRNWQEAEEGKLFSSEAAKFLGVKYGVLTNSGSSAGLLALLPRLAGHTLQVRLQAWHWRRFWPWRQTGARQQALFC